MLSFLEKIGFIPIAAILIQLVYCIYGRRRYGTPIEKKIRDLKSYISTNQAVASEEVEIARYCLENSGRSGFLSNINLEIKRVYGDTISKHQQYEKHISKYTLLGLLGTFIGLIWAFWGLGDMVGDQNVTLYKLQQSMTILMPSMAIAFLSSIFGIIFTFYATSYKKKWNELDNVLVNLENRLISTHHTYDSIEKQMSDTSAKFFENFKTNFIKDFVDAVGSGFAKGVEDFRMSIQTMSDSINDSMKSIKGVSDEFLEYTVTFKEVSKNINAFKNNIDKMDQVLLNATERFKNALERIEAKEEAYSTTAANLLKITEEVSRLSETMTAAANNVAGMNELNEKLYASISVVAGEWNLVKDLADATKENTAAARTLAPNIENISSKMETTNSLVAETTKQTETLNSTMSEFIGKQNDFAEKIAVGIDNLNEAQDKYWNIYEGSKEELNKLTGMLENTANGLNSLKENQDDVYGKMKAVFEEITQSLNQLQKPMGEFGDHIDKFSLSVEGIDTRIQGSLKKEFSILAQNIAILNDHMNKTAIDNINLYGELEKASGTLNEIINKYNINS